MSNPIKEYREQPAAADRDGCWPSDCNGPLEPRVMRVLYVDSVADMCEYLCPCGCGMPCPTFFSTKKRVRAPTRPLWDYSLGPNGPTLYPSVRHTTGCKAHYNITDGKVIWHGDSGK